jgi:hypothetical protein
VTVQFIGAKLAGDVRVNMDFLLTADASQQYVNPPTPTVA